MANEIGVKMYIRDQNVPIKTPVRSKFDTDGNLILTFRIGPHGESLVKIIFDKRTYLDIKDE